MFYYKDKDNIFILAIKIIVADNLIESDMCRYSVHGAISLWVRAKPNLKLQSSVSSSPSASTSLNISKQLWQCQNKQKVVIVILKQQESGSGHCNNQYLHHLHITSNIIRWQWPISEQRESGACGCPKEGQLRQLAINCHHWAKRWNWRSCTGSSKLWQGKGSHHLTKQDLFANFSVPGPQSSGKVTTVWNCLIEDKLLDF